MPAGRSQTLGPYRGPHIMGPHGCVAHQTGNSDPYRMLPGSVTAGKTTEIETMSAKILPAIVVGLLLGTTALASAQQRPYGYGPPGMIPPGMMMYPDAYWQSPYAGTPFQDVAPYTSNQEPDPYAGTIWDG